MTDANQCPECGATLPPDAPRGLCPNCLMRAALGTDSEPGAESSPHVGAGGATVDRAGAAPAGPTTDQPPPRPIAEGPGSWVGPYKLLQQIGEGGMGVVFMAEQDKPVRRKVALKVIKPGMDSAQVVARFEAERQALA